MEPAGLRVLSGAPPGDPGILVTRDFPPPSVRYVLRIRASFEAEHHLVSYKGVPETPHGHSWQVEVCLVAEALDREGMAFDFVEVRQQLESLVRPFDRGDLNRLPPFDAVSPTAEHLAAWLLGELRARLPHAGIDAVTVWEGPDCSATCQILEENHR